MIKLSDIIIYPIKSCAGIHLQESRFEPQGLVYDRRWVLVDRSGVFLSQRKIPKMALINTALTELTLEVSAFEWENLYIPLHPESYESIQSIRVWDDTCDVGLLGRHYDRWFSDYLQFPCVLAQMLPETRRKIPIHYNRAEDTVSFADGFPHLLLSEESLADLNQRLEMPVTMERFRPNLVVAGVQPFEEDKWQSIRIGEVIFEAVEPCARCIMVTIDPKTGTKTGNEPLRTLATYRKKNKKILFGQNLIHHQSGVIRTGDSLLVNSC